MNPTDIKTNINKFAESQFDIFKTKILSNYAELCSNINENLNENLMTAVGEDLYDYSDITCLGGTVNTEMKSFMIDGEKIIVKSSFYPENRSGSYNIYQIQISNFGRYGFGSRYNSCSSSTHWKYEHLNFWIPLDYIRILKFLLSSNGRHDQYSNILPMLKHLKENLESGKYVKNKLDIHYMDVYKKTQDLTRAEKKLTLERTQFKKRCQVQNKLMALENIELDKKIERTKLIGKKIIMERVKLKVERAEFDELRLADIDIDDL